MARRRTTAVVAPSRFPGELVWRLVRAALLLAGVLLAVLLGVGVFLTYQIVTASDDTESVTPQSSFQSNYVNLSFTDHRGGEHEGWLLVGLKGAPAIILCHGYNSNRSELLALGSLLRQNHFNVYVFNFYGPKAKQIFSDLGMRQADDLLAAIETVTRQPGVNPRRVGLFGTTTGGYAALVAAEQSPLVKALVVDTIYDNPSQMLDAQVDQLLGGTSRLFRLLPAAGFYLATLGRPRPPVRAHLAKLGNMPKLFVRGQDAPLLAAATEDLYNLALPPKRMFVLDHSYTTLASGTVKKEYEDQVLNFFLHNLPLRAD
jgi:pimeloyl-ACP methyl ester carboxylesterase